MFDAAQSVLEGVQRGGLVIVSLFSGEVKLQLLQRFNDLFLRLGFGRLLTTAGVTRAQSAQQQVRYCITMIKKKKLPPPTLSGDDKYKGATLILIPKKVFFLTFCFNNLSMVG